MMEKKSEWGDVSMKIIIAMVVPLTVAIIGIFGQMIVSEAGTNQRALERLVRLAEAETAFRRDMFAELFNDYVDQISATDNPQHLDALATRLELLSSNFHDFLKLSPLFMQLDRQINRILPSDDQDKSVEELRHYYQERLEIAAKSVINTQAAQISQGGVTRYIRIPTDYLESPDAVYRWPRDSLSKEPIDTAGRQEDRFELDGVVRSLEIIISDLDMERKQVAVQLDVTAIDSEGLHIADSPLLHSAYFELNYFSFPLENNMVLAHNHRLALSLRHVGNSEIVIRVQLFRHMAGYLQGGKYLEVTKTLLAK